MTPTVAFVLMVVASCGIGNEVSGQKISNKFREMFPYCRIGEDKNGAGVYYAPLAAWKFDDLAENSTTEEKNAFPPWVEEQIRIIKADGGRKGEGVIVVLDCAGLDIGKFTPDIAKLGAKINTNEEELSRWIRKILVINGDAISELKIFLLKGYWKELMSHAEIYGNDREEWEPQLLRRIPKDVLPKGFGGTNAMPELCDRKETRQKKKEQTSVLGLLLS